MSWRPMSSWRRPAPARRAAHAVHGLARRGISSCRCARANAATTRATGAGCCPTRHRAGARHRHAGGRASHHRARPASAAHPAGGGASLAELDVGGGADDPPSTRIGASPACRPRKGVRLEQPGRADLRRRRSGRRSTPSARGLCVVPAALRGRHGLARAGNPCARTPAPGRLRRGRHPPGRAGRRHRLSPDNAWVRWAAASIERSTGKRPALLPNLGGSLPNDIFADLLGLPIWVPHSYPACAQHAPNEHLLAASPAAMAGLFWDLGDRDRPCDAAALRP